MLTYVLRHVCGTDALPTWWTANHISFPYQFRVTQSSCNPSFLSWSFFSSGIGKYSYHQRSLAQYCPAVTTAVAFNSKSHRHSLNTSQLAADLVLQRSTLHLQTAFVLVQARANQANVPLSCTAKLTRAKTRTTIIYALLKPQDWCVPILFPLLLKWWQGKKRGETKLPRCPW